ncbi:MAG: Pathogenicity locus [Rhizobiales bacterium PAR1]|nr:MAG: Pathogenicity locus [Rhizobiales bacterium PAR1]
MAFSDSDRIILLAIKGVGPKVIQRLEEFGVSDLKTLAGYEANALCSEISHQLGSTCWRNSPLARKALENAIASARESNGH